MVWPLAPMVWVVAPMPPLPPWHVGTSLALTRSRDLPVYMTTTAVVATTLYTYDYMVWYGCCIYCTMMWVYVYGNCSGSVDYGVYMVYRHCQAYKAYRTRFTTSKPIHPIAHPKRRPRYLLGPAMWV
jgi:hypothetical protein